MKTISISVLKSSFEKYLQKAVNNDEQILVTTDIGNLVLISENKYNSMLDTIYLTSQKGLTKKIKEGEKEDFSSMSNYSSNKKW